VGRPVFSHPRGRIMVALDTGDIAGAIQLVELLQGRVGPFKVGMELSEAMLTGLVAADTYDAAVDHLNLVRKLFQLLDGNFWRDWKGHDIPNTLKGAALQIVRTRPRMLNVHASAGKLAMELVVANRGATDILAVTVLTTLTKNDCDVVFGQPAAPEVLELALFAADAGVQGLICSAEEVSSLRTMDRLKDLYLVVPGTRSVGVSAHDQQRVGTPRQAVENGADYLVIGRQITEAKEEDGGPLGAVEKLVTELAA